MEVNPFFVIGLVVVALILLVALIFNIVRNRNLEHYVACRERDARYEREELRERIRQLHRKAGLPQPEHPYDYLPDESRRAVMVRASGDWDANPDPSG